VKVDRVVVTCEHGGNRVPRAYAPLFRGARRLLASHRGWDPGAIGVARRLARRLGVPLHAATVTRLLVELNRSLGHRQLFSERTRGLPPAERQRILERYWRPYREAVEAEVARGVRAGRVLHLSVHSFTPVLDGVVRDVDVGLLYDPRRAGERRFCGRWARLLRERAPELRIARNRPYRGIADGLVTHLRTRFPVSRYLGLEVEISQRFFGPGGKSRAAAVRAVEESFAEALREEGFRGGGGG